MNNRIKGIASIKTMNVFTIAKGIDPVRTFEASLYLTEHLYGKEIADKLAGGLVIDWDLGEVKYLVVK